MNKLTDKNKEFLLSNSAYVFPDNPTEQGWSASEIKEKFYKPLIILFEWLKETRESTNAITQTHTQGIQDIVDGNTIVKKAFNDKLGNEITSTYETKTDANNKVTEVKRYADTKSLEAQNSVIDSVKNGSTYAFNYFNGSNVLPIKKIEEDLRNFIGRFDNGIMVVERAYSDENGNNIVQTYATKADLNTKTSRDTIVKTIGNATQTLGGLLTKEDKKNLDALTSILGASADKDTFVNTLNEILTVFQNYPEGTNLVNALASKVNVSDIIDNLTSAETKKPLSANQGKALKAEIDKKANATDVYSKSESNALFNNKQDKLVDKTNIKTINNQSILGSGNINVKGVFDISPYMLSETKMSVEGAKLLRQGIENGEITRVALIYGATIGYGIITYLESDYIQFETWFPHENSTNDFSVTVSKVDNLGNITFTNTIFNCVQGNQESVIKQGDLHTMSIGNTRYSLPTKTTVTDNTKRISILEKKINNDFNTLVYTTDKQIEVTCNGANIIDSKAKLTRVNGRTRRKSLNLFNVPSFDLSGWKYNASNCTFTMKQTTYTEYVLPKPFTLSKGTYTLLRTTSGKVNSLFYDTTGALHQLSYLENRKVVNFDRDVTINKIGINGESILEFKLAIVQGDVAYDSKYFEPFNNTLVHAKANIQTTGRNLIPSSITFELVSGYHLCTKEFIPCIGGTYTYKDTKVLVNDQSTNVWFQCFDSSKTLISEVHKQVGLSNKTFCANNIVLPSNTQFIKIRFSGYSDSTINQHPIDMCLKLGNIPLVEMNEPYILNTSLINESLGQYDYIDVPSRQIVRQTSDVVTLNGSENWREPYPSQNGPNTRLFAFAPPLATKAIAQQVVSNSTRFLNGGDYWSPSDTERISNDDNGTIYIRGKFATVEALKQWLTTNPITLVYKKATPQTSVYANTDGFVAYRNGLTIQDTTTIPYEYTAKFLNGGTN